MHACKRTGLDPLMKQIYAIKRGDAMSFQTGIDGYRLIADRTGLYAGSDEPSYMIGEDGFPDVASVTVTKLVNGMPCKFSASARWGEYVQNGRDGKPTAMWQKMPFLMLGKCAESLALRKAFPAELSGVYTHEEMMQADTEERAVHTVVANKQTAQAKINELRIEGLVEKGQEDGLDGSRTEQSVHETAHQQSQDAPAPSPIVAIGFDKGKPLSDVQDLQWLAAYYAHDSPSIPHYQH
jgi:phage recombination protein Bet